MHISFPEIQISRFEQLQILYFISFYTFKMKSISINRGGYFFILFILVASGIWKAESYSVKRRVRDKRVLLPYGQDRISASSSQSISPAHETQHRVMKRSPIMEWYYPSAGRVSHPNSDASNIEGSPTTYYIPPQDHANMLAEVQRFADHQLLPKGLFPDSSQYLNGQQSSQIPAGFQEQLTFLHTDSSHQDQTTSVDATKLALLEQVKHLADALTEGRAGNGNGLDTDLFETGLSQDLDEWTNPLQGRGKDQGHHNQKVIKSSQSHFPEELTNLNDPFVALFLSQLDHPHKTMHSDSKTKPGHVESIQLGDNGEYSSQLSPSVPISPFDPVVLDKDDPFLNLLLHKKDSYYSVPSSPSLSSVGSYPIPNTEDYDAYDPTDNFEYQTTTPSPPPSSAKQFLNPYSHQSHSHAQPTSTLYRPPKSQNSLDSLSIHYPTTTTAPTSPYDDDTIGYDDDYVYPPLEGEEVAQTQNPYPIYKYEPVSSPQKQPSGSSSQLKDRLQDFIDDSYTLPPPQAYDVPYQVQYPKPDEEGDDSATPSSYVQEESTSDDPYDDTVSESSVSEYPFLDPVTEKPYPILSPYGSNKPGDKHPSEYFSVKENPSYPDEVTSGYNYDDEENNLAAYPTQGPVAYSDVFTTTEKYSDQPSLQSKYYTSSTYKDAELENTPSPVFAGSLTSYPTKTLVPYPSATTTPKPTTTTTTTTATVKPTQIYDTSSVSSPRPVSLNKHTKPLYVAALQKALALQQMLRRDHRPTPSTNFYTNYQPDHQQYPRTHLSQDPILGRAEDEQQQQKTGIVQPNQSDIDFAQYHLAQFYAQQRQPHWADYYTVPEIQTPYVPRPQYIYHQQGVPKLIRSARKTAPIPKTPVLDQHRRVQVHHLHNRPLMNSKVNYWIMNTMSNGNQLSSEGDADRVLSRTHRLRKRSLPPPRESHHRPVAEERTRFLVYSPKSKVDKRKVSYWVRWQAGFWPDPLNIQPVSELPDIFSDFKVDKKTNLDLIEIDHDEAEAEQLLKPRRSLSKRSLKQNGASYSENALTKKPNATRRIRIQKLLSLGDDEQVNHISTSNGVTFDERDDSKYQNNYKKRNNLSILVKRTKSQSPKKVKATNFFEKYNISISPKYEDVESSDISEAVAPMTTTKRPRQNDNSNVVHRFRPRMTTSTTTPKPTKVRFLPAKETEVHTDESPTSFVYMGSHNLILPGLYSDETNIT